MCICFGVQLDLPGARPANSSTWIPVNGGGECAILSTAAEVGVWLAGKRLIGYVQSGNGLFSYRGGIWGKLRGAVRSGETKLEPRFEQEYARCAGSSQCVTLLSFHTRDASRCEMVNSAKSIELDLNIT